MSRRVRACASCLFYVRTSHPTAPEHGKCHRYPPRRQGDIVRPVHPAVTPLDWCGEHEPHPSASVPVRPPTTKNGDPE